MNRTQINGINIYSTPSRNDLIDYALRSKKILIAINAEKILHATEETKNIINNNIGYPDGVGAVYALKAKGIKNAIKIPGCELWLDIIRKHFLDKSFYFVGAKEEVIQSVVSKLKIEFPGIAIVGYRNGYIKSKEEKYTLINDLIQKKPDIVFVAMGSPKQEILMNEMIIVHPAVYQGLGGSFDVYTNRVKRAPKLWMSFNLEWAYRLIKEPRRFYRQVFLFKFLWLLLMRKF